jgi:dipeptidyl aminopeptidase/acylaminoacyl peptidase
MPSDAGLAGWNSHAGLAAWNGHASLAAWNCFCPDLAPDNGAVAFVCDQDGSPRVWIQPLTDGDAPAYPVDTGPQAVEDVSWAPDGGRLAVLVAPGGGEHTQVWAVRPDGGDLRPLSAPPGGSASFVRWTGRGEIMLLAETAASGRTEALLVDAATGARQVVAAGTLLRPAAVSRDHRTALLRHGPRGARRMSVSRHGSPERPLLSGLPGSTDHGFLSPDGEIAYLVSDAGRDLAALLAVSESGEVSVLAERPEAELDLFAPSIDGRRAVLVWNEAGRSELDVLDLRTGTIAPLPPPPADVVSSVRVSHDGCLAALAAEGPGQPSNVLVCDLAGHGHTRAAGMESLAGAAGAELVRFSARDGLELRAWLYRPPGVQGPAPYVLYLHGGPEDEERPYFNPLYQNLLAAGIGVLAPNVRGSAGRGRSFREADDRALRFHAIDDVADCATELVRLGVAEPHRMACMGWSYGGYLTLAALVAHPGLFRTGVDVCGIADFERFYARTEPWIAAAAVREYGHPDADRDLLRALSPLRHFDRLSEPLLVVHGAHDTNVPLDQAEQVIQAGGVRCEQLIFDDEGHEIRQVPNRVAFVGKVVQWLSHHLLG